MIAPRQAPGAWSDRLPGWEGALAVFILVFGTHGFIDTHEWGSAGVTVFQIAWSGLIVAAGLTLCYRFRLEWLVWSARRLPLLWVVLAIALASSLWSPDPVVTLGRAGSMIGTTLLGIYIGYDFEPRAIARILFWSLVILIASSIIVSVTMPDYGAEDGVWKGITGNRNTLGMVTAVAVVLFAVGTLCGRVDWRYGIALVGCCLFVLIMTGSATATLALVAGLVVVVLFSLSGRLRLRPLVLASLVLLGAVLGSVVLVLAVRAQHDPMVSGAALQALEGLVDPLDRNVTLTGRTELWTTALQIITERPWSGYGYGIVWGFGAETYLPHIPATASTSVNAHNGYLDVATQLGLPAAAAASLLVIQIWFSAVRTFERRRSSFALLAIGFLLTFMITTISESTLFVSRNTAWILFVAIALALQRPPKTDTARRTFSSRRERRRTGSSRRSQRNETPLVKGPPPPGDADHPPTPPRAARRRA